MKKKSVLKLALKKETLCELKPTETLLVQGGQIDTTWPTCPSVNGSC